jgi:hypothetical protein
MKAAELRVGNLLLNPYSDEPEIVDRIKRSTALNTEWEVNEEHPDFFKPIPLTEEWLLKFGFRDNTLAYEIYKQVGDAGYSLVDDVGDGSIWYVPPVKYVHQLQNLYFALTGTELELSVKESPLPEQPENKN